jgi:hypothetical protein
VYSTKLANYIADLKAISINLMHSNLSIIYRIYGVLLTSDMGEGKANLGNNFKEELVGQLQRLFNNLRND